MKFALLFIFSLLTLMGGLFYAPKANAEDLSVYAIRSQVRELQRKREREHTREVDKLRRYLESKLSPMAGNAADFIDCAHRYGVDYRLVVAISGKESTFGRFQRGFNSFGWDIHNGRRFASFGDAICTVSAGLAQNYKGLTIRQIAYRYAPPSENNTEKWIADVSYFKSQL